MQVPRSRTTIGKLGNTIAGALGGVGGGQILAALLPMLAGTAGNVDIGSCYRTSRWWGRRRCNSHLRSWPNQKHDGGPAPKVNGLTERCELASVTRSSHRPFLICVEVSRRSANEGVHGYRLVAVHHHDRTVRRAHYSRLSKIIRMIREAFARMIQLS